MKRLFLAVAMFLCPAICWGQQTAIQATIVDPAGHPYAQGSGSASINCPGNQQPSYNGFTVPRNYPITGIDGNGHFTLTLYDVNLILPLGCSYNFAITAQNGFTSFTAPTIGASASATPVTGIGPVNLSTAINFYAVPIPQSGGGGGGTPPALQTNGVTNTVQTLLNLKNGTNVTITADGSGGVTINSPSANLLPLDNTWTNNNRFKGPIPYRDVTAYMPGGGCDNTAASLSSVQGTILATQTALTLSADNHFKNGCGIFIQGAGATSTLLTPGQGAASNPVIVGATGSTTIHYKVAAIDANYGLSAASTAITVTTAPSTRTALNYVGIFWTNVANAIGYLVYTDQTGGGTYVPLNYSYDCAGFALGAICGAVDKGAETFTWTNGAYQLWPTTPPSGNTNQALITTIVSGAGTTNLVLAAAASNSTTNSFTLPDNAPFFKSAISDASGDGSQYDKGTVFVPNGMWFTSTLPFPSGLGSKGIKITLAGQLQIFGIPIMGPLSGGDSNSGYVSIEGKGGIYQPNDWTTSCSNIWSYPSLGAIFLVSNGSLQLNNICITNYETAIVDAPGSVTTNDVSFQNVGSAPDIQIDNNSFFSHFVRTNWNSSTFNPVWLLGLTNSAHSSVFDFRDNSFISHGIRYDEVFPTPGYFGNIDFTGTNNIEDNLDKGFINVGTNSTAVLNITADNLVTGDAMTTQYVFYTYDTNGSLPAINATIHGESQGFSGLLGTAVNATNPTNCRAWTYENSNSGGMGVDSIGYFGSMFGTYTGCDLGNTVTGYDVQTTEVLVSGGNDTNGSAGEQIIGHVFRRPRTTLTPGSGSLAAATYYIQVTMLDVAGRESAPSPEVSATVGASSSIAVSAVTQIYFPTSCKVYFGTSAGGEADYFLSTSVTNGTCTYTLTTTSGQTAGTPVPVGNAMRSWLSADNNANSCLFCGTGDALGSGFLGFGLTPAQYTSDVSTGGPALYVGPLLTSHGGFSGVVGATGPAAGTFTTLTATGNLTTNVSGGGTQCLHVNNAGLVSGLGADCGSSSASAAFNAITSGTNTAAAMVIGTGASLTTSGSGTNTATAMPFSGLTAGTGTAAYVIGTGGSITVSGSGTNYATTLLGSTWANPAAIGTGTPAAGTFSNLTDSALTPGTLPICPNGGGGLFTTSGCVSGGSVFPVTVSGTVNSGGIPCFNSTTNEESSAALASGILIAGGGAGACAKASSITDNGTTVSTSEPLSAGNASFGGGCSAAGATSSGGVCMTESANTGWTPTAGQDYLRADSTLHAFLCSINGAAEPGCTFSAPFTVNNSALATTPADSYQLFNNTASTGGATLQYSPSVHWKGHVWNTTPTAADNAVDWLAYVVPQSGASPVSFLEFYASINGGAYSQAFNIASYGGANSKGAFSSNTYATTTNCAGVGTAASPSVASCGSSAAGHFSCATNATGATCTVNTTAVTANSEIFVFESDTAVTGTALSVTCNTSTNVLPTSRLLASSVAATSFTINLGTVTTNPACFSYHIVN